MLLCFLIICYDHRSIFQPNNHSGLNHCHSCKRRRWTWYEQSGSLKHLGKNFKSHNITATYSIIVYWLFHYNWYFNHIYSSDLRTFIRTTIGDANPDVILTWRKANKKCNGMLLIAKKRKNIITTVRYMVQTIDLWG